MSAKEQLRQRVQELSEEEAAGALLLLDNRASLRRVPLNRAPADDEGTTSEEEAFVRESLAEITRGETVSLEDVLTEFGE